MIDPISLAISAAMKWGPSLIGGLMGDGAEKVAGDVIDIAMKATGKSDPQDAMTALEQTPELALQFQQALMSYSLKMAQEDTKRLQAVNATMQVEAKSEHWPQWSWRPFNGYMFGITLFFNYAFPQIVNMFQPSKLLVAGNIPEFVFMAWASVLGVTAWHRGVNKRIENGDTPASPLAKLKGLVDRTLR